MQWHRANSHVFCSDIEPTATYVAMAPNQQAYIRLWHRDNRHVLGSGTEQEVMSVATASSKACLLRWHIASGMSETVAPIEQARLRQWHRVSLYVSFSDAEPAGVSVAVATSQQTYMRQ